MRRESEIVNAICHYLRAKRRFFWRQNNNGVWDAAKSIYRRNRNTMPGVPDIFVICREVVEAVRPCVYPPHQIAGIVPKVYAIEVKSESGRQSDEQKEFQARWEAHGGIYVLARSLDDVIVVGL